MINPVGNVSAQAFTPVNTVGSVGSYFASSSVEVSSGLTQKGAAFLALMALAQKDDEKLSNAQKLGLLALALGATNTTEITSFSMMSGNTNNIGQLLNIAGVSPAAYTATATTAVSSTGVLFNTTV